MKKFKRILASVLAVVMLVLCCAGCSTPATAMTIGDYEVSTGEYLANLYNMFYQVYYNGGLYYYPMYYGYTMDQVWDMEQTYGEGDDEVKLKLPEYIKQMAKDSLIRQQAVKQLMAEYEITLSEEDQKSIDEQMKSYDEAAFLKMGGFNKANYLKMLTAYNFEESALFYGLYQEGGQKGVADTAVREYFDTNYLVYKTFSLSLKDADGADLKEDEAKKVTDQMNGYLEMFNDGKSVDEIYKQYLADEEAKEEAAKKEEASKTTTTAGKTTTTAAPTTTTAATTTTTVTTTTATGTTTTTATGADADKDDADKEEEDENKLSFSTLVATSESANEDLVKAIKDLEFGEASLVTYSPSDKNKVIAFVVRYQHSDEYKTVDEYFEDVQKNVLYTMKSEEFEDLLEKPIDELTKATVIDDRAISMCDPKKFAA